MAEGSAKTKCLAVSEEESVVRFFQERKLTETASKLGLSDDQYQPSEDVYRVMISTEILEKQMELQEIDCQLFDLNLRLKTDCILHPKAIDERIASIDQLVKHLQYLVDHVKEIDEFVLLCLRKVGDTISLPESLHRHVAALPETLLECFNSLPKQMEVLNSFPSDTMDTVNNLQILRQRVAEVVTNYKEMEKLRKQIQDIVSKDSRAESQIGNTSKNLEDNSLPENFSSRFEDISLIEPVNEVTSYHTSTPRHDSKSSK